jgi:hypothetical protein
MTGFDAGIAAGARVEKTRSRAGGNPACPAPGPRESRAGPAQHPVERSL